MNKDIIQTAMDDLFDMLMSKHDAVTARAAIALMEDRLNKYKITNEVIEEYQLSPSRAEFDNPYHALMGFVDKKAQDL